MITASLRANECRKGRQEVSGHKVKVVAEQEKRQGNKRLWIAWEKTECAERVAEMESMIHATLVLNESSYVVANCLPSYSMKHQRCALPTSSTGYHFHRLIDRIDTDQQYEDSKQQNSWGHVHTTSSSPKLHADELAKNGNEAICTEQQYAIVSDQSSPHT